MAESSPDELPMAVQLAGCEPEVMAEAAKLNEDRGAALIDINFGCPVKKVVNGHAGSALMRDEIHAARILEATVKAVNLPVTLKMRTGWDHDSRNAPRLARIAAELRHQDDHGPWPHALPVLRRHCRLGLSARGQGSGPDPRHRQRRYHRLAAMYAGRWRNPGPMA